MSRTEGMRLQMTRRGDYAIRAMLTLARQPDQVLSGTQICRQTGIPERFLPQVMRQLVRADLAHARIGRHGGYQLGKAAETVCILDIVEAVEGDSRRQRCVLTGMECDPRARCQVHAIFASAQEALLVRLAESSLASAVQP